MAVEAFWLPAQIVTQYKRRGRTCKQVHLDLQGIMGILLHVQGQPVNFACAQSSCGPSTGFTGNATLEQDCASAGIVRNS